MIAAAPRVDDRLFALCGLAWAAGLIHSVAALTHLDESALHAVFFAALAIAQLAWGIALYRAPSGALLRLGALASVLVVALWALSRTSGLPVGPEPLQPEPVGTLDALASADEALLVLLAVARLRGRTQPLAHGAAACLILFSALALASGHATHQP